MKTCAQCQAPLDSKWKFCINCGTPIPADVPVATADPAKLSSRPAMTTVSSTVAPTTVAATPQRTQVPAGDVAPQTASAFGDDIPAAIRNDQDGPPAPLHRGVNVPLIVSICLGASGTILIVYIVILVFGTRG